MSNQTEQSPQAEKTERQFVIGESLLQSVLNSLGEQKLKDSLNLYMAIQQGVAPLENYLTDADRDKSSGKEKG